MPLRPIDLHGLLAQPSEAEIEFGLLFRREEPLVIFDIGACEAEDSIRFARHYPHAKIFAFEPLPDNLALARHNLDAYRADHVTLVPVALSDREGEAVFHVSSGQPPGATDDGSWNYGNKSSSLLPPASAEPMHGWVHFEQQITVPTQTLDRFCAEAGIPRIDFIQMDVQGAESKVLAGATRMLPHITAVWLEVSRKANYRGQQLDTDIAQHMRAQGFHLSREVYRGDDSGEGDHLYLNLRHARTWRHVVKRALRARAGRIKRALLRLRPSS